MPGGFQSRLIQVWITWDEIVEADGRKTYVIAISPIQEYRGTRHSIKTGKMVCADSRGVYVIKEVTENTCEWTWVQNVNLKISVLPANAMDFIAMQQLFWADEVHEQHRRNDREVDMEYVQGLLNDMKSSRGRPLMDDQVPLLERCKELLGTTEWKSLELPDPDVKMMMQYQPPKKGERSIVTGKATSEVDCSAEVVAAWTYNFKSKNDMRKQADSGLPRIEVRDKRRANERTFALIEKLPFPLNSREFVFRILWKVEDSGEVLVAIESVLDEDHVTVKYGTSHKVVKASVRGLWRLKNVSSRGGASRCEVEFYQRIDAGGVIPTWVVNRKVPYVLSSVQTAVNLFRQDEKIDTAERDDLMSSMQQGLEAETYTEEEEAWIKAISEKYEKSSNGGERTEGFKKLISPDPYVKMESMIIEGVSLNMADKSTAGCARAIAIIDASFEECAAFDFKKTSREKRKSHRARKTVTIAARGSILTERMESVEARETVAIRLRSSGQFNTKMDYACMLELGASRSRA
ncbi:hypothetical protein TrST_g8697 [Triparma strigata]|uniref:START domain-containing protein n=1 Tax=Triparma strigata TaxID=1606541 RepID=A0A9W7EZG6_9STRA|nr:hypothetical protein TrST_g8697 [Triparma strigata]